jgi:hypothetical protein
MMTDTQYLASLSKNARAAAQDRFNVSSMARSTYDLYKRLLKQTHGKGSGT